MRNIVLLAALLSTVAIQAAVAQEPNYSRTLDEQLERVRAGKTPVPKVGEKVEPFTPSATRTVTVNTNSSGAEVVERDWQDLRTTDVAGQNNLSTLAPAAGVPVPVETQKESINSVGGGAIPALLLDVVSLPTGIKYITGGVGEEETTQLKQVEREYNVQMLIATKSGAYLSGVTIRVTDSAGREELMAENAGPYFYTLLPEGTHTFEVTSAAGNKQSVKVSASTAIKKPVVRFVE